MVNDCIKITGIYAMDHDRAITKTNQYDECIHEGIEVQQYTKPHVLPMKGNFWDKTISCSMEELSGLDSKLEHTLRTIRTRKHLFSAIPVLATY
ncbi:hypothetical protein LXL04_038480 [Taraxacum kok-saghyz]